MRRGCACVLFEHSRGFAYALVFWEGFHGVGEGAFKGISWSYLTAKVWEERGQRLVFAFVVMLSRGLLSVLLMANDMVY